MNQLEYIPGIGGQSVQMDGPTSFVGIAENLRSREWEYDLGFRDLVSATRPAREVDVNFYADYATADDLRRVADADVTARTPGIFVAQQEWRQRGYILASKPSDIHCGRLSTELKVALLDGAWWRLVSQSYSQEEPVPERYETATGKIIYAIGAYESRLHSLTVFGESVQDGTPTPSNPVPVQLVGENSDGVFGISVNGQVSPIDLQGNVLASLPNGTTDVLNVDADGHVVLTKNVAVVDVASSSWVLRSDNRYRCALSPAAENSTRTNAYSDSYTVALSAADMAADSIGIIDSGAYAFIGVGSTVVNSKLLYPLAVSQTIDLGYITMPMVYRDSQVFVVSSVTPTITAEWRVSPEIYLDYSYDYEFDYSKRAIIASVTPSVLTPSAVYLVVYGPAINPYVIVGDNTYQVNVTVPAGGYLTVDGRDKTIVLTLADGTVQNVFSSGVRGGGAGGGSYIFEKIPAGTSEVTYDGSFGFDLGWYEEEGEPPWSQS